MIEWKPVKPEYGPFEYDGKGNVRSVARLTKAPGWVNGVDEHGNKKRLPKFKQLLSHRLYLHRGSGTGIPFYKLYFDRKMLKVNQSEFIDKVIIRKEHDQDIK